MAVEIAAATRFAAIGMEDMIAITEGDPYMRGHAAAHAEAESLFVAVEEATGRVAGFAAWWPFDGLAHLCELDVHPEHSGQGLGRRLIAAGEAWARDRAMPALTLSTFIDVPWNGPWYERLGFVPYPPEEWREGHRAIWRNQVESALDCSRRHIMIKRLSAPDSA